MSRRSALERALHHLEILSADTIGVAEGLVSGEGFMLPHFAELRAARERLAERRADPERAKEVRARLDRLRAAIEEILAREAPEARATAGPPALATAGDFEVIEWLAGGPSRGRCRARWRPAPELRFLGVVAGRQTRPIPATRSRLLFEAPGIAALRAIGCFDGDAAEHLHVLFEDEPAGEPLARAQLPIPPAAAARLALDLVAPLERVHAAGTQLAHLRPELIYVRGGGAPRLTAVAPRCEAFLETATPACEGVLPLFETSFQAPEVLALREASAAADVFSLSAILAWMTAGEHPFEGGDATAQMFAILGGRRRETRTPPEVASIVEVGLAARAEDRPALAEVAARLAVVAAP